MPQPPMRINRYIAASGYCSRRAADRLIAAGEVRINGVVATVGTKVSPGDTVAVRGKTLCPAENGDRVYIAFNKPKGITCTSDTSCKDNIIDYIHYPRHIFTVGRLDRDSRGLILLTDDGDISNRIIRARYGHEKEYAVAVNRKITPAFLDAMQSGVPILGTVTRPCRAWKTGPCSFGIILKQGLNRQIRRMCSALNYSVTDLLRTRVMHVTLDGLAEGEWRELTPEETAELIRLTCGE